MPAEMTKRSWSAGATAQPSTVTIFRSRFPLATFGCWAAMGDDSSAVQAQKKPNDPRPHSRLPLGRPLMARPSHGGPDVDPDHVGGDGRHLGHQDAIRSHGSLNAVHSGAEPNQAS